MEAPVDLTLFAHVTARSEDELDLAEAALLIAEAEHPGLDVPRYLAMIDRIGADVRRAVDQPFGRTEAAPGSAAMEQVLHVLYGDHGFRGNNTDYYDPRNSYLNQVLDRRLGIPITLAIVLMEVCRRAGITAQGVSFPGHFLVRSPLPPLQTSGRAGMSTSRALLIDPFEGRLLGRDELKSLANRVTGSTQEPSPKMLQPASKRQILVRMLSNLRAIYAKRQDPERLREVIERIQVLAPSEELRRELDQLGGRQPWPTRSRTLN
ncbi:SirB1 family protein [Chondromyces apiculatus]|uniref:Protein sirB1 n=1 Tax=Chondromyces apiculatus DSM 436 TaxID=1192034 RepID=A0A017T483_9BACT|nr:transglutaminase-like domain-containing protein [Chondromyces apiculatus]EYF04043.1 Protein sirB1 [Chondromyces apiculatus DSM 436]